MMDLSSPAFGDGDAIPRRHTCDGDDVSPPLAWSDVPEATRSFALIVDDPDAPGRIFTHWLAWGIPADREALDEGEPPPREGRNDFGRTGYGGPCPPPGHGPHRYVFRLFALDDELDPGAGAGKGELEGALEGHILAEARLVGAYER